MKKLDPRAVWLLFSSPLIPTILIFALFEFFFIVVVKPKSLFGQTFPVFLWWLLLTISALAIVLFIWAFLDVKNYRYELLDNAFHQEGGVIWHESLTIPYERIQSVDIRRGIIARFLGLSDVIIRTAGVSGYGKHVTSIQGRIPGVAPAEAIALRDQLIKRARQSVSSGL